MRYFIYCRISGANQQEQSLENQEAICRKQIGRTTEEIIVIKEIGSGKDTSQRPNFVKMIESLEKGDRIYVYDQSRMGRNAEEALFFYRQIKEKGAELYCDGKPYGTLTDKFLYTVQAGANEFFREMQMQKSREGQQSLKDSGNWVTKGTMLGWNVYKIHGQTKVEVNPIAKKWIEYIFIQYSTGRSFRSIANDLENVVIPGFETYKFAPDTIERVINQPLYMGYNMTRKEKKVVRLSRQELEGMLIKSNVYEPLISEDLFWKCYESYRTVHRKHSTQFQYRNAPYELSTLFKCAYCSAKWTHHYDKEHGKGVYEKYRSLAHTCDKGSYRDFNKDALENLVRVTLILTFLDHEEVSVFFQSERDRVVMEKSEIEEQLEAIEKMMSQNKKKMEKLLDLAMNDELPRDIYNERMKKLTDENTKLMNSKSSLLNEIYMKEAQIDDFYADLTRDVLEEYSHLEPSLRRDILKKYVKHAYVLEDGFEIEYLNGKKFITDMWKKRIKKLTPLTMKVSFKGEEQYTMKVHFMPERKVEILDEDYGEEQTNLFFYKRNRRVEKEVGNWLDLFTGAK